MKKLSIMFASVAMLFGVGLGVSALDKGSEEAAPVQKVEADNSTKTLYINQFDGGGNWNNFSYYLFGGSKGEKAAWPGEAFTDSMKTKTPNEYDQYQYVLTVNTADYPKLVLVGNPQNWGGSQAQTNDLVIDDMSNNGLYCGGQIPNTNKFDVGYYGYATKTVYMLDLKGDVYSTNHYCHTFATGKSGTTFPGVQMSKVAGQNNLYSVEINAALDNVIFNNNGSKQTATIGGVSANDAYVVYPDNGYNKLTLDATRFVDSYMKFETKWLDNDGDGSCKSAGWYSSAKSAFNGKTAEQKAAILAHEPTQYRLAAWARANGDTLNTSTNTLSSGVMFSLVNPSSTSTTLTVIIITVIALGAVGGFFLIKRKKKLD